MFFFFPSIARLSASLARPPPPPPPPPPLPDKEDVVVLVVNAKQNTEPTARDEKRDVFGEANRNGRSENLLSTGKLPDANEVRSQLLVSSIFMKFGVSILK